MQQRVSLGTNLGSEGETSVGDVPQQTANHSPARFTGVADRKDIKMVGPSMNSSKKAKRQRLSPYARPQRLLLLGPVTAIVAGGDRANNMNTSI
jgi:hypothetical protein